MTDLSSTIAPKSDQMNADDLISGPRTITITKVTADTGSAEQPILIYYEGDGGKPYKPCKSMRRVMVSVWGKDGAKYPGRRMTLFRDQSVTWGGMAVGGIRISHMSDIDVAQTMALTATRSNRKPFTVKPLGDAPKTTSGSPGNDLLDPIDVFAKELAAELKSAADGPALLAWWKSTEERRTTLAIPDDRLTKMQAALTKQIDKLK